MQEEINQIVAHDLLDYSFKVEQAIKEGWTFSDKNELCPRAWPHMFQAFMVKVPKEDRLQLEPSGSLSVASEVSSEGADSNSSNKLNLEVSSAVSKPTRRNAKK